MTTTLCLTTERLYLRPLHDEDTDSVYEIFRDAETMRYWSTPPHASVADSRRMISRWATTMATGKMVTLAITEQNTSGDRLIGVVILHSIDDASAHAELGYILHRDFHHRGIASEAVRALVQHGFTTMKLHRIEAALDPDNHASKALLTKLGFSREGLLRERWCVNGEFFDGELYGLLVHDYPALA